MAILSEITDLLRRWDVWKRVEEAPSRIDALEKRLVALESRLQRAPGAACPSCGELSFRVEKSVAADRHWGDLGARNHHYKCGGCGFEDVKMVVPE
jgi:hypothetical protein